MCLGAQKACETIAARRELEDVEGYMFQFGRAAHHAKEDHLVEIGKVFKVPVALPSRPVKLMRGDADLVLKDGILVETSEGAPFIGTAIPSPALEISPSGAGRTVPASANRMQHGCCDKGKGSLQRASRAEGTPIEIAENAPFES